MLHAMPHAPYPMPHATCHMRHATCHMSHATCHISYILSLSPIDSASDEESELARLVAPSQPMDSSMEQDSLCDSSMDSSALGQSIGGGGAMGVVSGVGGAVGVALQETPPAQVSDTGMV